MVAFTIDLRDGFENDLVIVSIDGDQVYRKTDVRTRYQISLADQIALDLPPGSRRIGISLPERDIDTTIDCDPQSTPYLGVSFERGKIVLTPATEAFGYL